MLDCKMILCALSQDENAFFGIVVSAHVQVRPPGCEPYKVVKATDNCKFCGVLPRHGQMVGDACIKSRLKFLGCQTIPGNSPSNVCKFKQSSNTFSLILKVRCMRTQQGCILQDLEPAYVCVPVSVPPLNVLAGVHLSC